MRGEEWNAGETGRDRGAVAPADFNFAGGAAASMPDLTGKSVLVLGLGETGLSLARWLDGRGARVRVADSRADPPNAARLGQELPAIALDCGPFRAQSFDGVELIAISPGVPRGEPLVAAALARGVPVVGDIELFAQVRPRASRLLAITGSNGKSTVTAMAGAICKAAGLDTVVAGNIGLPVLDALARPAPPAVYVLELSSFQLESTQSLGADAATLLNLSEDHLDRYPALADYAAAKARVFQGDGVQVLNRDDRASLGAALPGRVQLRFGLDAPASCCDWGIRVTRDEAMLAQGIRDLMPVAELRIAGRHNAANALAALALARAIDVPEQAALAALRAFDGLPHRTQLIAEIGGVQFYDDSKGTNVGATVAALAGLARKAVLIAGGDGKGQDFGPLAGAVAAHASAVVLIGRDRERIAQVLAGSGVPLLRAESMAQAVEQAHRAARPGEAVLLSPACASFDMFRSYEHRAQVFAQAVAALAGGGK